MLGDVIGRGAFGTVYLAEKKEYGSTYVSAVKHIAIPGQGIEPEQLLLEGTVAGSENLPAYYDAMRDQIIREINCCYALRGNTNIVSYEDHCILPRQNEPGYDIFIRMEYLHTLTELQRTRPFRQQDVIRLGMDISTALEVLHRHNMLHRDIRPDNIFVSSVGTYKLGDFGESRPLSEATAGRALRGTTEYLSPEIASGQQADIRSDLYSLGLMMYRMLNGDRMPFEESDVTEWFYSCGSNAAFNIDDIRAVSCRMREIAVQLRLKGEKLPKPEFCADPRLSDVILKACEFRPEDRWQTPKEMQDALEELTTPERPQKPQKLQKPQKSLKPEKTDGQESSPPQAAAPEKAASAAAPVGNSPSPQENVPSEATAPETAASVSRQGISAASPQRTLQSGTAEQASSHASAAGGNVLYSGKCGSGLTYALTRAGELQIRGRGAMEEYQNTALITNMKYSRIVKYPPWTTFRSMIRQVTVEEGVTSVGSDAFSYCQNLTRLRFPRSLERLGDRCLRNCTALRSADLPDGLQRIGNHCFSRCTALCAVILGKGLTAFGQDPFEGCSSLIRIGIHPQNAAFSVANVPFANPAQKNGKSLMVPALFSRDFRTLLRIPCAAAGICDLTTLMPPLSAIGESAFSGCSGIWEVSLPQSLQSIGDAAFAGCTGISLLKIPSGVKTLGKGAFAQWTAGQQLLFDAVGTVTNGLDSQWKQDCSAKIRFQ